MTEATQERPPRNMLKMGEIVRLSNWLAALGERAQAITVTQAANEARTALQFDLTPDNVRAVAAASGVTFATRQRIDSPRDRTRVVAMELVRLQRSLGMEPVDQLLSIAHGAGE